MNQFYPLKMLPNTNLFKYILLLFFVLVCSNMACIQQEGRSQSKVLMDSVHYNKSQNYKIQVGAENLASYVPYLKGKSVGLVVNNASMTGDEHLLDTLLTLEVNVEKVFSPEHGFDGKADAGEGVKDSFLERKKKIELISLYGDKKKPSEKDMEALDVILFDLQDVGVRFYTYIYTMQSVMEACAAHDVQLIVLDRPNPNGHFVDGPILEKAFESGVGKNPVPVVHGMTIGEYARMLNGESWLEGGLKCDLKVIKNVNYTHNMAYEPPVPPSPNLPDLIAISLYPSLCFFEGTPVSIGRGTEKPFTRLGHPDFDHLEYTFVPEPNTGARYPKLEGQKCYGYDLSGISLENFRAKGKIDLSWLLEFYRDWKGEVPFFNENGFFDKLAGTDKLRKQIISGMDEESIRASWEQGLEDFKLIRQKYLLYPDFE